MSNILPFITAREAVAQAKAIVLKERSGEQLGLYTHYPAFDRSMGKYARFSNVNLYAGLSGHGKSYLLNSLTEGFTDKHKNAKFGFLPIVLQFCFEMSAADEILRSCASDLGISYSHLLSSQYDKKSDSYNRLTDEELLKVEAYLSYYENKSIIFIEVSGNVNLIYNTVEYFYTGYKKKETPILKYAFIVNIDHTLLIDKLNESDLLELMGNVGKVAIRMRKDFQAMVNLLGQLNNNIEDTKRLLTPTLHFPQKSDIYAQGQLFNACDNVYVIHQPQLLKIDFYGKDKIPTANLIHLIKLKSRHGTVGNVWLYNDLKNGRIIEVPKTPIKDTLDDIGKIISDN